MPGIPVQVPAPVQVQGMQSVQLGIRQPGAALAYQTIPVIGPGGVQYTIPVQSLPHTGGHLPVASMPAGSLPVQQATPLQPIAMPQQPIPVPISVPSVPVSTFDSGRSYSGAVVTVPSYARPAGYNTSFNSQPAGRGAVMTPTPNMSQQTITMPSGTYLLPISIYNALHIVLFFL